MKNLLIFCAIFLSACVMAEDTAEHFSIGGMDIYPDEYNISQARIIEVIIEVEQAFNEFFPGLNLLDLIEEERLYVYYFDFGDDNKYRGLYYSKDNTIHLDYPEELLDRPEAMCMENYYVLGHEMMHFVTLRYLNEKSREHDNPNIWIQWGVDVGQVKETAEYVFYSQMAISCGLWKRQ
jgi:hypothetical protein